MLCLWFAHEKPQTLHKLNSTFRGNERPHFKRGLLVLYSMLWLGYDLAIAKARKPR